jgi:DNA transposition AAA+ family ATPase
MYNKQFKGSKNLKKFGEICIVTTKKQSREKLNNRGTVGLFLGYPDNHANDVYRIFNIKT